MSTYRPGRAPSVVHSSLVRALAVADSASAHALLWFSEVLDRHLYRERGHLSIQRYAEVELGFSTRKTEQFVQLAGLVRRFRRLRRSLVEGRLAWTQVRTIAPVLTPASESHWVARAETRSRRALAREIAAARTRGGRRCMRRARSGSRTPGPALRPRRRRPDRPCRRGPNRTRRRGPDRPRPRGPDRPRPRGPACRPGPQQSRRCRRPR